MKCQSLLLSVGAEVGSCHHDAYIQNAPLPLTSLSLRTVATAFPPKEVERVLLPHFTFGPSTDTGASLLVRTAS